MLYLGLPAALATGAAGTGVDVSSTRSAALITIGDQWRLSVTLYRFVSVMLQIRVETCDTEENLRYRGKLARGVSATHHRGCTFAMARPLRRPASLDFTTWPGMNRLVIPAIEGASSDSAESHSGISLCFCSLCILMLDVSSLQRGTNI